MYVSKLLREASYVYVLMMPFVANGISLLRLTSIDFYLN